MAWTIEFTPYADKRLDKIDASSRERILRFLHDRVATLDNPRKLGAALQGTRFEGIWKYRVGDYRILAHIQDDRIVILITHVGHRKEVYRN